jgi:outer membrane protein assembly factor BamB
MLRGDAARSCAAKGDAEPTAVIWRQALAARPEGWIVRSTWRAQHHHNQTISAPVVAGGKVFVSLNDQHQVVALEAPSGQVAWRYTANARIDSPPTIHKGLCLFGCRDGWVYCLRAADGRLAWRRRIAPSEQRILVYGQFESRWPVIGTILSDGDRAYANAGHDPAMNILLWEFDPATGKTFGFGPTPRSHFPNDMLVKGDDGGIYLNRVALRGTGPATESPAWRAAIQGYVAPRVGHLNPLDTSIISSADTVSLKPRGGLYLRQIVANRWTWDGARLIGFTSTGYRKGAKNAHGGLNYEHLPSPAVFCLDPSKLDAENGAALRWQTPAEDVWAMALAGRRVIIAGPRVGRPKPPSPTSQPTAAGLLAALRTAPTAPSPSGTPLPTGIPADRMWDSAILSTMVGQWSWWQQDPLAAPGFVRVLDAADGKVLHSLDLPSAVVQDGIAVSGGRAYVTTADGSVCCLGTAAKPSPASHPLPR